MEDVFEHHLAPLGVPILHNLPLGHGDHLCTIPLGVTATVDAGARTLVIEDPALDAATGGVGTAPAARVARV
jgi:muramoyltetrapeptide carboxypeptidase